MCGREIFPVASSLLLSLLLSYVSVASGESTGEDAAGGNVQTGIIASFGVDSALVSVGGVVELRCRVTRIEGGNFVQLSKVIPGTTREELLTTNRVKEDSISGITRYSIEAERNGEHGYDFVLRITDVRVEDSGSYICSVPMLDETKNVEFFVVSAPTSLQLYVNGHHIDQDNSSIEYDNITQVNVTCAVTGGHPQPIVTIRTNSVDVQPTSVHSFCLPQPSDLPTFLPNLTCSATVNVRQFMVDRTTSGIPVTCTARSRGSPDVRLSASFVPLLTGAPPVMKCERSVTTPVHELSVRLVCHIMSTPPLSDAHITWDGQQHLRPTERPGWPPGVKFDRDQEYAAYLRQSDDEAILELELEQVSPQMYREYEFVASNRVGISRHTVTLVKDPTKEASRYNSAFSFRDVTAYFTHVISLAVTSVYMYNRR